ncbi:MAG TPA: ATP-binding cassette domain-containing protein [Elusimicrobiales bacterium]|nr:ATP-binding cassette domain-containing protein [Elusimicrobiales bacterium]
MEQIELKGLTKTYVLKELRSFKDYFLALLGRIPERRLDAVSDVSFSIAKGEFVGLIGRNGAGKSTLIKLLTGILTPTSGEISVLGRVPHRSRRHNNYRISAVFGQRTQLKWDISAYESFRLIRYMYDVPEVRWRSNLERFAKMLDLSKLMYKPVRTLSLGQRMRMELCAAFLYDPELVFLDEPTIGLDIFAKEVIGDFLLEIKRSKETTVLLTTHDVSDIERLCERTMILDGGKVVFDGETSGIAEILEMGIFLEFKCEKREAVLPPGLAGGQAEILPHCIKINGVDKRDVPRLTQSVMGLNNVLEIKVEPPDFEKVLKNFYASKIPFGA